MTSLPQPLELKKTHDSARSSDPKLTAVFVHGLASDSRTFDIALEYLENHASLSDVRFVTFDLLGSGKSYKSNELSYGYTDQLTALDNSLDKLNIKTPLILVGHSMGTLIVTRYASKHKRAIQRLVLISPPVFTEKDLDNPAFKLAMDAFKEAVSTKDRSIVKEKSFNNSIEKIVKNRKNYQTLAEIDIPTVLIYGEMDKIIGAHNIPKLLKTNSKILRAKTPGRHGVSHDKFNKIREVLEEEINAQTI